MKAKSSVCAYGQECRCGFSGLKTQGPLCLQDHHMVPCWLHPERCKAHLLSPCVGPQQGGVPGKGEMGVQPLLHGRAGSQQKWEVEMKTKQRCKGSTHNIPMICKWGKRGGGSRRAAVYCMGYVKIFFLSCSPKDTLLNVFLAIAVDNLANAQELTKVRTRFLFLQT